MTHYSHTIRVARPALKFIARLAIAARPDITISETPIFSGAPSDGKSPRGSTTLST
jgi:hypothetical protein